MNLGLTSNKVRNKFAGSGFGSISKRHGSESGSATVISVPNRIRPKVSNPVPDLQHSLPQNKKHKPEIGSIAHEIGIADVMLDDPSAQDDHAGVDAEHGEPVDPSQVIQNVDYLNIEGR